MSQHILKGKVKDLIGLPIKDVHVKVTNQSSGKSIVRNDIGGDNLVTDAKGEYNVDLDDISGSFSNGDSIKVELAYDQPKYFKDIELTVKTYVVDTGQGGGTVDFEGLFIADQVHGGSGFEGYTKRDFNDAVSMFGMAFQRVINSDDGVDLATSFANARVDDNNDVKYVTIMPGFVAVITSVYVSGSGTTDTVTAKIVTNDASDGNGQINTDVTGELNGKLGTIPGWYKFAHPKRVKYIEGQQESILFRYKGSGTTDDFVGWFEGYLIKEEYND